MLQDIAAATIGVTLVGAAAVLIWRPSIVETISRENQERTQHNKWYGRMTDADYTRERAVMKVLAPLFMLFVGIGFLRIAF